MCIISAFSWIFLRATQLHCTPTYLVSLLFISPWQGWFCVRASSAFFFFFSLFSCKPQASCRTRRHVFLHLIFYYILMTLLIFNKYSGNKVWMFWNNDWGDLFKSLHYCIFHIRIIWCCCFFCAFTLKRVCDRKRKRLGKRKFLFRPFFYVWLLCFIQFLSPSFKRVKSSTSADSILCLNLHAHWSSHHSSFF